MKQRLIWFLALWTALALLGPRLAPHPPEKQFRTQAAAAPSAQFLLGTDELGRDRFSRLLHASQWSLFAGASATVLTLFLGLALGLSSAAGPSWWRAALHWAADLSLSLPWLYLLIAFRSFLPLSLAPGVAFVLIITLVGLLGWAAPAKFLEAAAQESLASDYVRASRAMGASTFFVLRRHVMPHLGTVLVPQFCLLLPQYVLAESALSFLGLGLGEPTPTWGTMLANVRERLTVGLAWWDLAPLLPVAALSFSSHWGNSHREDKLP
ncbi:MAG: ABC transporter permease [Bryobacter sp.]|nr:ABC transporter permease [Bryobacter sp.]